MIAQFYIRLVDKVDPNKDPDLFRKHFHAGDVVVIQPKGWCWGKLEISSPDHAIIGVEVESIEKAEEDFMASEHFDKDRNPNPVRRKVRLDVAAFPADITSAIASKDPEAVKTEYEALAARGVTPVFSDEKATAFKIPEKADFDPYAVRVVKPDPKANPFIVGADPFEVK
jgi:hypothetical protein